MAARALTEAAAAAIGPKPKIEEEIEAVLGDNQVAKAVEGVAEAVLDAPVVTEGGVEVGPGKRAPPMVIAVLFPVIAWLDGFNVLTADPQHPSITPTRTRSSRRRRRSA